MCYNDQPVSRHIVRENTAHRGQRMELQVSPDDKRLVERVQNRICRLHDEAPRPDSITTISGTVKCALI